MWKCISKLVSKFKDYPTVNEFEIIVLLGDIWVFARKKETFGTGKKENEFGRKRECRNIS